MSDVTIAQRIKALMVLGAAEIAKVDAEIAKVDAEIAARVAERKADDARRFKDDWQPTVDAVSAVLPEWAREFISLPETRPHQTSYGVKINLPGDVCDIRAYDSGGNSGITFCVWEDYYLSRWEDCEDGSPWYVLRGGSPTEFNSSGYENAFAAAVSLAAGKALENKKAAQSQADAKNEAHRLEAAQAAEEKAKFEAETGHALPVEPKPMPKPVDYLAKAKDGIVDGNFDEAIAAALVEIALTLHDISESASALAQTV